MGQIQERLKDISELRNILENQTKFLSLSGLSGIIAGFSALGGAAAAWIYMGQTYAYSFHPGFYSSLNHGELFDNVTFSLLGIAALVLVIAVGGSFLLSRRLARQKGMAFWNSSARKMTISLAIPLLAGGLLCFIQLYNGSVQWLASNMLLFYGLALLNASKYTLNEVRYLGMTEVALGIACALWWGHGFWFWVAGFGLMHIVYGAWMYFKYER